LTLILSSDGTSQIVFGSSPAPAPPTDPNIGYPTEYQYMPQGGYPNSSSITSRSPIPGFAFTLHSVAVQNNRLQFDAEFNEAWKQWCELQTPIEWQNGAYGCVHNWGSGMMLGSSCVQANPETQELVPVDCAKLNICTFGMVCECTAQGCSAGPESSVGAAHFDLNLDGNSAHGSTSFNLTVRNVHLVKN